jgi:hypothetical protein
MPSRRCPPNVGKIKMAIRTIASFPSDQSIQFLKVRPTVGQLDQDSSFSNILSFGNDLAGVPLMEASSPYVVP